MYYCNLEEHAHGAACFDESGTFICRLPEHAHQDACLIRPTAQPTAAPSEEPTTAPSGEPTAAPSEEPTAAPSEEPTTAPSEEPTAAPEETPEATQGEADEEPEDFVYMALDGIVTVYSAHAGTLTAEAIPEGDARYEPYAAALQAGAAEQGKAIRAMQIFDIRFAAEQAEKAPVEVELRLDAATFADAICLAHLGEGGWERLTCQTRTDEGTVILRFAAESFSPFAALTVQDAAVPDDAPETAYVCGKAEHAHTAVILR